MGVVLRCHHRSFIPTLIVFTFLLLFSTSSAASLHRFNSEGLGQWKKETARSGLPGRIVDEKWLGGPGSAPPKCRLKCGKCEPCRSVHVPIQPGVITSLEYYPEAWRCKCGNKIFMP